MIRKYASYVYFDWQCDTCLLLQIFPSPNNSTIHIRTISDFISGKKKDKIYDYIISGPTGSVDGKPKEVGFKSLNHSCTVLTKTTLYNINTEQR